PARFMKGPRPLDGRQGRRTLQQPREPSAALAQLAAQAPVLVQRDRYPQRRLPRRRAKGKRQRARLRCARLFTLCPLPFSLCQADSRRRGRVVLSRGRPPIPPPLPVPLSSPPRRFRQLHAPIRVPRARFGLLPVLAQLLPRILPRRLQ